MQSDDAPVTWHHAAMLAPRADTWRWYADRSVAVFVARYESATVVTRLRLRCRGDWNDARIVGVKVWR